MPKSKRSKVVSLTKVTKKTREHKNALLKEVQENTDKWEYCWLFEVGNMRNAHLKTVRKLWKDSARMFFGRGAVMAKAIGTTPEEEYRMGLHRLAKQIKGQVGLFFTSTPPDEVIAWFDDFQQPDFARAGNTASRTVTLPAGPVMQQHSTPPEPFPHNEEPQLRKLGLRTKMQRGVPTLETPHTVCEEGKMLNAEQAQLLKLVGIKMVRFRVGLRARWEAANGEVVQLGESEIAEDEVKTGEEADGEQEQGEEADELMSDLFGYVLIWSYGLSEGFSMSELASQVLAPYELRAVREFSPQISDRQMWRIEERRTVIFAICMHFKLLQHHTRHARSLGPITIYSSLGILPKHSSHRMYGIARVRACVFAGGASTGVRESFSEPAALMLADIAVVFIMTSTLTLYDVRRIGIHWCDTMQVEHVSLRLWPNYSCGSILARDNIRMPWKSKVS